MKSLIDAEKMDEAVNLIQGQHKNAKYELNLLGYYIKSFYSIYILFRYISDLLTSLMLHALEQSGGSRVTSNCY